MRTNNQLESLVELMARLRSPEGCPWDREQTFASLGPMLIEEAYELLDAVEAGDWEELRDELGDMLFQLVFYAQLGAESGRFTIWDSIARVHEKMVRRHPHVFGEEKVASTAEVLSNWEAIKAAERSAGEAPTSAPVSMLDGVSKRLPALLEAHQLTTKAARVGFDWPAVDQILEKLEEELAELRAELQAPDVDQRRVDEEVGDILFVVANLARRVGTEPETGLRAANRKFRRRFGHIEQRMAERGGEWREVTLATLDQFWEEAKRMERESLALEPTAEGKRLA
ncbi:MAG: nucleoside triphosphate pyrophosphohydrolase [Blastocatellia bacterium]